MSFLDWLRNALAGPPRIQDGGDPEAAADLHAEFGVADGGAADLRRMEDTGGAGGYVPGERYGASEAAEAAETDLASEEAPPDPDS
jgi:hypothetical protein